MRELALEQMEIVKGGHRSRTVDAICGTLLTGTVVLVTVTVYYDWWNPAGWGILGLMLVDAACAIAIARNK